MKRLKIILLFFIVIFTLVAQSPKREMRATWLATVWQIDWPANVVSSTGNSTEITNQKNVMIRILDSLASANMNAVCFQVRSRCDAMYQSAYEPWSTDLVATRGMNPGYDPLAFVIEEGHKRGIEVHAWLNPYRYESVNGQWTGQAGDYRTAHPDWILSYSSGSILDPGNPAVIDRIKHIIGDIVQKYDVDGILFDDYFYAYGGTPAVLDSTSQALYKPANMDLGDWRRQNVNNMVAAVYDTIQAIKPQVRFGVSPFGIWTTDQAVAAKEGLTLPPGITGGNMYAEIYCDPVAWLKQGKVDYISPQLYWGTGGEQDYGTLCPWWSEVVNLFGKQFYSSQDLSGLATSSYAPGMKNSKRNILVEMNGQQVNLNSLSTLERNISSSNPQRVATSNFTQEQIGTQIGINRSSDENNAPGSVFFSTKTFYTTKGFINYLKKYQYTQKSLVPAIHWKQHQSYGLVTNLVLNVNVLTWNAVASNIRYVVYAIPLDKINSIGNFSTSKNLIGISYTNSFTLPKNVSALTNGFAVAVLDRFGNEFPPQIMGQTSGTPSVVNLILPINAEYKIMPFDFSWEADATVENYLFEVAEDIDFTKLVCSRELTNNGLSTTQLDVLQSDRTYYWRVKTRKPNTVDGISSVRSFIPQRFSMLAPLAGATNVSITPIISWQNANSNNSYFVEISIGNQFAQNSIVYSTTISGNSFTVPTQVLIGATTYYVRVTTDILGIKTSSNVVNFTTLSILPETPVFLTPVNQSSLFGPDIKVTWSEGLTSGYRVEMSKEASFPVRNTTIKAVNAYVYEITYTELTPSDYYFRVRANYSGSYFTAWSDTLQVTLKDNTAVNEISVGNVICSILKNNDSQIFLKLISSDNAKVSVSLMTLSGIKIQQIIENQNIIAGSNLIPIPVIRINKGGYLIVVKTNQGQSVLKFIR